MSKAIVHNAQTGQSVLMTAAEFEQTYAGNKKFGIVAERPQDLEHLIIISPQNGYVLRFRGTYRQAGNTKPALASFVRPNGYGNNSHIFNRAAKDTWKTALNEGKVLLFSLNMDLTPEPVSFEGAREKNVKPFLKWIEEHNADYLSVSIRSAQEAISMIKKVHEHNPAFPVKDQIFVLYQGVVMPYNNFYLGHQNRLFVALYDKMKHGQSGLKIGEERMLGLPRLIRLTASKTTRTQHGLRGLKGNLIELVDGSTHFSQLVFNHEDDRLKTGPFRDLRDAFIQDKEGIYVLACPSISINEKEHVPGEEPEPEKWQMLRWVINDVETQTASISLEGKERLRRRRFQYHHEEPQGMYEP